MVGAVSATTAPNRATSRCAPRWRNNLSAAAHYVAAHGFASKGAPVLVSLVSRVAAKFSVNVGEKLAVQAVPLVGAVSGATLNTVFMRHFQAMARGHFIVRRLERRYGQDAVRRAYEALPAAR